MSGKIPYMRLYPGEELQGPVSGCSIAAQGLWLRLRMIMHSCEPYGYLCPGKTLGAAAAKSALDVGDNGVTEAQAAARVLAGHSRDMMRARHASVSVTVPNALLVARMCGVSLEELVALSKELDEAGVTRYTVSGVMYCEELIEQASAREDWASRKSKQRNLRFPEAQDVTQVSHESHADVPQMSRRYSFSYLNKKGGRSNGKQSETERREESNKRAIEPATHNR